jgi:hypothetical protein
VSAVGLDLYIKNRHLIRPGDTLGWESNTLVGETIQAFCASNLNHISTVDIIERVPGRNHIMNLEALENGFHAYRLSKRLREQNGHAWLFRLNPIFDPVRMNIVAWCWDHIDTPYDFPDLFMNAFGRRPLDVDLLFCSESAQFALHDGLKNAPKGHDRYNQACKALGIGKAWRPSDWPLLVKCRLYLEPVQIL